MKHYKKKRELGFRPRSWALLICILILSCNDESILDTYPFPSEPVFFEHLPIDLTGVSSFVAMGDPNVTPKDHGGFPLKNPYTLPANVPVIAVRSGVIILAGRGTRYVNASWSPYNGQAYDDYQLRLKISENVVVNYAHVSALNFNILPTLEDLEADETGHEVQIVVESGDTLGWVGPHPAMDFSVTDFSLKLNFLNPSRYPGYHIYAADIYNYLKSPLLDQMVNIAARDAPPWGGKVDYDIEGRIIGNWFLLGTTSFIQWSRQLAIVYDNLHSERIFISDGSPMQDVPGFQDPGRPDIWWVKGNTPRPENVGVAEGIVKYTLILPGPWATDETKIVQGVMLVQMINEGSIRVEVFKGSTSATAFTSAARTYER
jgi:hypothetical protein